MFVPIWCPAQSADPLRNLHVLALQELEASDFEACYQTLTQLSALPVQPDTVEAQTQLLWGRYYLTLDQFSLARPPLEKSVRLLQGASTLRRAESLLYLAFLNIREGAFVLARKQLDKVQILLPDQESLLRGEAGIIEGIYFQEQQDWQAALAAYEQAGDIFAAQLGPEHPKLAMAYVRQGLCRQIRGDALSAEVLYHKGLAIQQRRLPPDHLDRVLCYNYLGILKGRQGDHGQAIHYFEQGLRIVRRHLGEHHRLFASGANNMGNAYLALERYEEAAMYIEQAVRIFEALFGADHLRVAAAYFSLGISYFETQQWDLAISSYQKTLAIRIQKQGPDHISLAEVYNNLGAGYERKEDYPQAQDLYRQAVRIGLAQLNWYDGRLARYHNNVGNAYRLMGQYEQALDWHQQALMHLAVGFEEKESRHNPHSQQIADERVLVAVLKSKALTLQQYAKEDPTWLAFALATYQLAAERIDSLRQQYLHEDSQYHLAENAMPVYEGAISCAYRLYRQSPDPALMETAFLMSEKNKAALLLQSIKGATFRRFGQIPDSVLALERDLSVSITQLDERLFKARFNTQDPDPTQIEAWENQRFSQKQRADSLTEALARQFPAYFQLKYDLSIRSLAQVRKVLPSADHALIEYFVGEQEIAIFYVADNLMRWLLVPKDPALAKHIADFRAHLAAPFAGFSGDKQIDTLLIDRARQLYQQLIAPLYQLTEAPKEKWVLVPDGVLGYLPFDALLTEQPRQTAAFKSYPYLLLQFQIAYAYSANILQEMAEPTVHPSRGMIAFAPVFTTSEAYVQDPLRSGLSPLQYNQLEAKAVQEILGGELWAGPEATESRFRAEAGQYQVIHLSSHAQVNDHDPLFSQIAFTASGDSLYDDFLTVAELFDLRLPTEMIVLSACETGVGKLYRGEGIVSQARGFAYAGAQSMITSLWNVNDAATAELMVAFYQQLKDGLPKDAALRAAKLQYLQQSDQASAHPFFWAGFVPIGDMSPLNLQEKFPSWFWILAVFTGLGLALGMGWRKKNNQIS